MRRLAARSTSCRCISQTANASPLITYLDSTPPVPAKKEMDISTRPISSRTVRQKLKHSRQAIALSQPLRSLQFSSSSSGWKPVPARAPNTILNTGGCIPTDINSDFGFGDYYAWYTSNANAESESSGSTATTTSTPDLSTGKSSESSSAPLLIYCWFSPLWFPSNVESIGSTTTWGLRLFRPTTQPHFNWP